MDETENLVSGLFTLYIIDFYILSLKFQSANAVGIFCFCLLVFCLLFFLFFVFCFCFLFQWFEAGCVHSFC